MKNYLQKFPLTQLRISGNMSLFYLKTYQKILELDQMTQEELARTMGKSQSAVANKLRLLSLPEEVQKALLKDKISERHARTLLKMSNPEKQIEYAQRISNEKITVRDLERLINKENNKLMGS